MKQAQPVGQVQAYSKLDTVEAPMIRQPMELARQHRMGLKVLLTL